MQSDPHQSHLACRYIHTTSETVDINDVENAVKLMTTLLTTRVKV